MPARKCTKHSKRKQQRCNANAMTGKDVCYHHGGRSLSGSANGNYRGGRYSKILPIRLQKRYEEARTNPRLLSLTDDISIAEARLVDLFQRVDSGESGALWQSLRTTFEAFNAALTENDVPAMDSHLATLHHVITQGCNDSAAWNEIQKLWETRCKLTQTETKTLLTLQQMVTTEQLMTMFGIVSHAIQEAVRTYATPDASRKILDTLSVEFNRISNLEEAKGA